MNKDIKKLAIKCEKAIQSFNSEKIDCMIAEIKALGDKVPSNINEQIFYAYFLGNLHSQKAKILEESSFSWRKSIFPVNKVQAINYFRKSLNLANNKLINFFDIRTNLANELNGFCRTVESTELLDFDYDKARSDSKYTAPYARSISLRWLAQYLNDPGHSDYYMLTAYQLLKCLQTNTDKIEHPDVKKAIINSQEITNFISYGDTVKDNFKPLCDLWSDKTYKKQEKLYKKWCLDNNLFLNDLNDITKEWVAAQDILQFPNYIVDANEGPFYSAAFSDLKSRYCYARHLAFEGFFNIYPHYERNDLYLADTLDYVEYSGPVENLKVSIRLCFSILDSMASLMNQYFGIKNKKSSFTPKWIQEYFKGIENPFIDALYWLSCDLCDSNKIPNWKAPNPNTSYLRILRNDMEHNWVRIAEFECNHWNNEHDYVQTIPQKQLEKSTLEIFKYVRSALLYFIFAVKYNEKIKEQANEFIFSITTPIY